MISEAIEYFGAETKPGFEFRDPNSWLVVHACNRQRHCCTAGNLTNIDAGKWRGQWQHGCKDGPLYDTQDPDETGQTVEVEHFGPHGVELAKVTMKLIGSTVIKNSASNLTSIRSALLGASPGPLV